MFTFPGASSLIFTFTFTSVARVSSITVIARPGVGRWVMWRGGGIELLLSSALVFSSPSSFFFYFINALCSAGLYLRIGPARRGGALP